MVLATLFLVPLLAFPKGAYAYDAGGTHPWIVENAVELLTTQYPGQYDDAILFLESMKYGARHEDDIYADGDGDATTLRVMRHFFHPESLLGLEFAGSRFPNSFDWSMSQNEMNEWDFEDGRIAFENGDKESAYFILGHVMHLIADLTVPAHTHLDEHGPFSGDDYESYMLSKIKSDGSSAMAISLDHLVVAEHASFRELWNKTAKAAYYRNVYPGELGESEASGVLAEMFPSLQKNWVSDTWEIPGVGLLGEAFVEIEPGYFYFPKTGQAQPLMDRARFDFRNPKLFEFEANVYGKSMVENLSSDLVPLAILQSAVFLKMALDDYQGQSDPINTSDDDMNSIETLGGCNGSGQLPFGRLGGWLFLIFGMVNWATKERRRKT